MTKQTLLVGIYSSAKIVQATSHTGFVSFIDHNDPQRLHKAFGSERTDAFKGQIILKGLFGVLEFSQKMNE